MRILTSQIVIHYVFSVVNINYTRNFIHLPKLFIITLYNAF
jgi:hypothetical protein